MSSEFEESDADFWIDYENPKPLENPKKYQKSITYNEKYSLLDRKWQDDKTIENEYIKSFYEDKIQRVRESKEAEITSSKIITRNKTRT